jgi:hypothetical protein
VEGYLGVSSEYMSEFYLETDKKDYSENRTNYKAAGLSKPAQHTKVTVLAPKVNQRSL